MTALDGGPGEDGSLNQTTVDTAPDFDLKKVSLNVRLLKCRNLPSTRMLKSSLGIGAAVYPYVTACISRGNPLLELQGETVEITAVRKSYKLKGTDPNYN